MNVSAAVGEVFGVGRRPARPGRVELDLAKSIQGGLPFSALSRAKERIGLSLHELSRVLGISERTAGRLRGRRLPLVTGDRLYRLVRIFVLAEEVFEDNAQAREWLRQPQVGLNYQRPLDLVRTEAGAREVERLLLRIEYGVIA